MSSHSVALDTDLGLVEEIAVGEADVGMAFGQHSKAPPGAQFDRADLAEGLGLAGG